jgi:hypothetical protein
MTPISESYIRTVAPSNERRRGGGHDCARRARMRVTSDAVVSAYVHEIAKGAGRHSSEPREKRSALRG